MSVQERLELARLELLDMGLRANPLLHVPNNRRFLDVVDERAADIYSLLVEETKAMRFLAIPEVYEQEQTDGDELPALEDYLEAEVGEARYQDLHLQTRLTAEQLDTQLLRIDNDSHTLLNEQGIEVLYLALGFLEWYEDPNASTPRYAPLVLLPVQLSRESARQGFTLNYTEADLGPNLTLNAKMKGEFRVWLPDFEEDFDLVSYFDQVDQAIEGQARWRLHRDKITLGLFQFGKFQMYTDLDPAHWPDSEYGPTGKLINQLLSNGFQSDAQHVEGISEHEYINTPEALHLIKDADSSQLEATLAIMEGASLVVQGPPGTGKSQTITNVIAEAVARGKKVLFVAQKMAALDVVKLRLDEAHLGDAVLELHSHKSSKPAVLESLRTVFQQGKPVSPDRSLEYQRLAASRSRLNDYVMAISQPILQSEVNFVEALGRMLQGQNDPRLASLQRIHFTLLRDWGRAKLAAGLRVMTAIELFLKEFGPVEDNVFSDATLLTLSPSQEQDLKKRIATTKDAVEELVQNAEQLATGMGLPSAQHFTDIMVLHRAGQRALDAPHLDGIQLSTEAWQARRDEINTLIASGSAMEAIYAKQRTQYIDAIFEADLLPIRSGLAGRADKWWRIFSGEYRRAKQALQGFAKEKLSGTPVDWLNSVDELLSYQKNKRRFAELADTGASLFGAQWQGEHSDWAVLQTIKDWVITLYEDIGKGELPQGLTDFLQAQPDLKQWQEQISRLQTQYTAALSQLQGVVHELKLSTAFTEADLIAPWQEQLHAWEQTAQLYTTVRFNQLQSDLDNAGLGSLVTALRQWRNDPAVLSHWLDYSYFSGLVDEAYAASPEIGRFDRLTHERLIQEFAELDKASFSYAQETLVAKLHADLPNLNAPGEMDVLRREFSKKRRHIPIRRLLGEAGTVIQQAKPIFMMSPMSVSTYLPQGQIDFDLVIFDEASQIPAPEALGAIMRGKQVVVVGDSKQMPPTSFFSRSIEMDDETAEQSATADVESILELMLSRGAPERMLRWHYRSRHESLIAVSNHQFYNNRLLVFPGPGTNVQATGLHFHHLPHTYYDRGGSRTNRGEAQAVAQAVLAHIRTKPQQSLGVVAFSMAQREAIMLEVERLRRQHPETEDYFRYHAGSDEFFIKNLENVQGDERDTIFISIGYGRTQAGNLSMGFGPINTKGGERRLNVLISRSVLSMEVFCNFTADDLNTTASSPFGVRALKVFLKYAETGMMPVNEETHREPDSPFELEVMHAIEQLGYEVQPQVGSQGFYLDLAVRDPSKPGRYVLAVECDGASYHSSMAARDRDRLRQSVLEGLGWRFHRIWSTEWFRNSGAEVVRLQEAIEAAIAHQQHVDSQEVDITPPLIEASIPTAAKPEIIRIETTPEVLTVAPYEQVDPVTLPLPYVNDFQDLSDEALAQAIHQVVATEGPIHLTPLTTRLVHGAGLTRSGTRIQRKVRDVLSWQVQAEEIVEQGDVYSLPNQTIPLRDWSDLAAASRRFEFVADAELQNAIRLTVKDAYSIARADCMVAALNLIGFKRVTATMRSRLEGLIDGLISEGELAEVNGRLVMR